MSMSRAVTVVLVLALVPCPPARGQEAAEPGMVDRGHASVSRAVTGLAANVDSFFSTDIHEERSNKTRIRIGGGVRIAEFDGVDPLVRLRLDLRLPRFQRRLHLIVSGATEEDEADEVAAPVEDDNDAAGFLRFFLIEGDPTELSFDAGTKLRPEPDPFVRARFTRAVAWGANLVRPTQFGFWELQEGLGTRTRVDYDRRIDALTLARLRGQATVSQGTNGVEMRASAFLFRRVGRRTWLRGELRIDSDTDPPRVVERYRAALRVRRSVWRDWLFVEIEPQLRFEREHDYGASPAIDLRVETLLGGRYGVE